jgi:hypothetical protein
VSEGSLRADIGFPAENDSIADREVVEENLVFTGRPFDEGTHAGDELIEFSFVGTEVGMDRDSRFWIHVGIE